MSDKPDKWVEAVTKLIKLTQAGELKWSAAKTDKKTNREDIRIETVFLTKLKNRILRLYKYSYMIEEPGPYDRMFSTDFYLASKRKYPYWASSIILEFIDEDGRSLWTFPQSNVLNDLLGAVQYQVAGVDEFLKEILED